MKQRSPTASFWMWQAVPSAAFGPTIPETWIPCNHTAYWRRGSVKMWNRRQRKLNYRWSQARCAVVVGLQKAGCKTTLTTPCKLLSIAPPWRTSSKLRVQFEREHFGVISWTDIWSCFPCAGLDSFQGPPRQTLSPCFLSSRIQSRSPR